MIKNIDKISHNGSTLFIKHKYKGFNSDGYVVFRFNMLNKLSYYSFWSNSKSIQQSMDKWNKYNV